LRRTDSLMAIDNPEWLFGTLGKINEPTGYAVFKNILFEQSSGKIRERRTVELYLYWLIKLELLSSTAGKQLKTTYARTALGDKLCGARQIDKDEYQKMLGSILLRSEYTRNFFIRFLRMIEDRLKENNPLQVEEARSSFRAETERSLYSLGLEAGLITDHHGRLGIQARKGKSIDDLNQFHREVENAYEAVTNKYVEGVEFRPIYVEISTVRDIVLSMYGIGENEEFDKNFVKLLDSPEGRNIHVYGAPPQWSLKRKEDDALKNTDTFRQDTFVYHEKTYVFMSIA
jgi:hypothetical protein